MMKAPSVLSKDKSVLPVPGYAAVSEGIVQLLNAARLAAARNINALMTASYWEIGRTVLPDEKVLAEELERSREELEGRRLAGPKEEGTV